MRIAIGSDHTGFALKGKVIGLLEELKADYIDFGTHSHHPCEKSVAALPLSRAVASGSFDLGILICDTGVGSAVIANKVPGVRAACLTDVYIAKMARERDDANVMTLGAEVTGEGAAIEIVKAFIKTPFSGDERFLRRRIAEIEKIFTEAKK